MYLLNDVSQREKKNLLGHPTEQIVTISECNLLGIGIIAPLSQSPGISSPFYTLAKSTSESKISAAISGGCLDAIERTQNLQLILSMWLCHCVRSIIVL